MCKTAYKGYQIDFSLNVVLTYVSMKGNMFDVVTSVICRGP